MSGRRIENLATFPLHFEKKILYNSLKENLFRTALDKFWSPRHCVWWTNPRIEMEESINASTINFLVMGNSFQANIVVVLEDSDLCLRRSSWTGICSGCFRKPQALRLQRGFDLQSLSQICISSRKLRFPERSGGDLLKTEPGARRSNYKILMLPARYHRCKITLFKFFFRFGHVLLVYVYTHTLSNCAKVASSDLMVDTHESGADGYFHALRAHEYFFAISALITLF